MGNENKRQSVANTVKHNLRRVQEWNAKHVVGIKVTVTMDDGTVRETVTRSEAWLLGAHTAVVQLDGISGAYALARVRAVEVAK